MPPEKRKRLADFVGDLGGIGYVGIGFRSAGVAAVPLDGVAPLPRNAESYPLRRSLYLYLDRPPGTELDPLRAEFLKYVLSREGQAVVVSDGYLPVSAPAARKALEQAGIKGGSR